MLISLLQCWIHFPSDVEFTCLLQRWFYPSSYIVQFTLLNFTSTLHRWRHFRFFNAVSLSLTLLHFYDVGVTSRFTPQNSLSLLSLSFYDVDVTSDFTLLNSLSLISLSFYDVDVTSGFTMLNSFSLFSLPLYDVDVTFAFTPLNSFSLIWFTFYSDDVSSGFRTLFHFIAFKQCQFLYVLTTLASASFNNTETTSPIKRYRLVRCIIFDSLKVIDV